MNRRTCWAVIVCAAAAVPLGCAQSPRPLTADLFVPPAAGAADRFEPTQNNNVDPSTAFANVAAPTKVAVLTPLQPQPLASIEPLNALAAAAKTEPVGTTQPTFAAETPSAVADASSPTTQVADEASPAPVPGTSRGVYMTIGGVIAKVNGTPIYSCQVLRRLNKQFAAKAREMSESEFRRFASEEIDRQLDEMKQDEQYFNMAYNSLEAKDRELAEQITIHLKQEKITAAGGSLESAKRAAAAEGQDFDESMTQTYRQIVHDLFQRRVFEPLVQIGRDDLFNFYKANVDKLYSEKSKALFRVIQIDPTTLTGADADKVALDKITAIREKAAQGADFAALASADNSDSYLKSRGGDPGGWMEPNTYRLEDVEKALWQLDPGQVTPVIKAEGAYYVAKLVDKKIGVVRKFDDATVQEDAYNRLRQQQINARWRMSKQQSFEDAVVTTSQEGFETAVDVAMQKYKILSSRAPANAGLETYGPTLH